MNSFPFSGIPDVEPSGEPVNSIISAIPSDYDYTNEEIIPSETNKYGKVNTLEGSNLGMIFSVGVGSAVVLAIGIMVSVF